MLAETLALTLIQQSLRCTMFEASKEKSRSTVAGMAVTYDSPMHHLTGFARCENHVKPVIYGCCCSTNHCLNRHVRNKYICQI